MTTEKLQLILSFIGTHWWKFVITGIIIYALVSGFVDIPWLLEKIPEIASKIGG